MGRTWGVKKSLRACIPSSSARRGSCTGTSSSSSADGARGRRRRLAGPAVLALLLAGSVSAYTPGFLGKIEFPRTRALGGAGVGLQYAPTAVWINPAASARVQESSLSLCAYRGLVGDLIGNALMVAPAQIGVVALGVMHSDAGPVTLIASDDTVRTVNASQELMGVAGLAKELGSLLSVGILARVLRSELVEEFTQTVVIFDLGAQLRHTQYFKAGLSIRNIGNTMRYDEDEVPLPAVVRVGCSLGSKVSAIIPFWQTDLDHVLVVADGEYNFREEIVIWRGGIEYWWHRMIVGRFGGHSSSVETLGNFSAGLGFALTASERALIKELRVDYAVRLRVRGFDAPQSIGLTLVF